MANERQIILDFLRWLESEKKVQLADVVPQGQYVEFYAPESVAVRYALSEFSKRGAGENG